MRGKQQSASAPPVDGGLIPACAGKTKFPKLGPGVLRAHPRVCGENSYFRLRERRAAGSSPRVRGKRIVFFSVGWWAGLIPACAGKTAPRSTSGSNTWAHPRVCGENAAVFDAVPGAAGSSPRVRGKRFDAHSSAGIGGLIPACAGKTRICASDARAVGAHPRVCGENTERSGVLRLRSVRSWKTLSFPSSLKVTHCRTFVQLSLSRIRL